MTYGVQQIPCRFCKHNAVVDGWCTSCNKPQKPPAPRTARRRSRPCRHRLWLLGEPVYVKGEMKRTDRCKSCGVEREMEVGS